MGKPKRHTNEPQSTFLNDELSADERAMLGTPTPEATAFRRQVDGMQQTRLMLLQLPTHPAPVDFSRAVQQRIRRTTHGRHFSGIPRQVFPYEAAVSVVVLIVLMVVYWMGENGGTLAPGHHSATPAVYQGLADQVARIGGTVAGQTQRCPNGMELWFRSESEQRIRSAVETNLVLTQVEPLIAGSGKTRYCASPR